MNRNVRYIAVGLAAALAPWLIGCDSDGALGKAAPAGQTATKGGVTMEWETLKDPMEGSFTVELPKGWKNEAYMKRAGVVTASIVTSASPDGRDALFYGDPKMPTFVEPASAMPHQRNDPAVRIQTYTPAERFLPTYLKGRFGKLPGFTITNVASEPELVERNRTRALQAGLPLQQIHSARVEFTFQSGGETRRGLVYGTTSTPGLIWMASVAGIVSLDDPMQRKADLFHVIDSQKLTPEWKEKERVAFADRQRQHEATMANIARNTEILRLNHQNNMATLNAMAARHQIRMDAIHAAGDASMAAYRQRDAASDANHQGFLNVIREENTVATSSGRTFQVDNRYDRYYVNKSDNSYIGLKGGANLNDIRGIDPGDYEEAKILR